VVEEPLEQNISGTFLSFDFEWGNVYRVNKPVTFNTCEIEFQFSVNDVEFALQEWGGEGVGAIGPILGRRKIDAVAGINHVILDFKVDKPGDYIIYHMHSFTSFPYIKRTGLNHPYDSNESVEILTGANANNGLITSKYYFFGGIPK